MAVVVDHGAAVAEFSFFKADAWLSKWAKTDAFAKNSRLLDLQNARAFGDDRFGCHRIRIKIVAHVVRAAEDAVVRPWDRLHQRRVVAYNRAIEIVDLRNDRDLAAMRLKIRIFR